VTLGISGFLPFLGDRWKVGLHTARIGQAQGMAISWCNQLIAPDHRVVVPDLRGMGSLSWPIHALATASLAKLARRALARTVHDCLLAPLYSLFPLGKKVVEVAETQLPTGCLVVMRAQTKRSLAELAFALEPVGPDLRAGLGRNELSVDRDGQKGISSR
jgi:hypothetical protein